ncbi:MAG: protein phosphatase 2C domain-containing protein, partial [Planctomycetaceae bacterium]|nr:protein phosphatase 2C domain-containing protein [Planctomycetaceae bacterium]
MPDVLQSDSARDAFDALRRTGSVVAGTGAINWKDGKLAIHTDFGPAGQDKEENQDFVLAWTPDDNKSTIDWAVVMADGVTSSFLSGEGARIACSAGLTALITDEETRNWRERARRAMDAAGTAIGELADEILIDPDRFRPAEEFDSTWRYLLREGRFLQTTLSLVWSESRRLNVAIVGDGGVITEGYGAELTEVTELIDEATSRVHALGPNNRIVSEFDFADSLELLGTGVVAVFTDGIGRGITQCPAELFEVLRNEQSLIDGQVARRIVQELM